MNVEVREQQAEVNSSLETEGPKGVNSSWQVPSATEPSNQPSMPHLIQGPITLFWTFLELLFQWTLFTLSLQHYFL